ncbi:MAG TPA: potassium channel family protein [Solirubrobacterales bacterium]|nr:potassium channel family protein [Solirubrobacterales bacterium]
MSWALTIAVILLGGVKVADAIASGIQIKRTKVTPNGASVESRSLDWTPVFAWGERREMEWGEEVRFRRLGLRLVIDGLFRSPVLASLLACLIFLSIGSVEGRQTADGGCHYLHTVPPLLGWMTVAGAMLSVGVALTGVLTFLQLDGHAPKEDLGRSAGQTIIRTHPSEDRKGVLGPVVIAVASTIALFVSFAAVYMSLLASSGSALSATPCDVNWIDMLYFSTAVGATVGFGDLTPVSDLARLSTVVEVVLFITVIAVFLQSLRTRG